MGEYANTKRLGNIKLGTCESLYYMRADQMPALINSGILSCDIPLDVEKAGAFHYRFRFPFPDEDHLGLGEVGHDNFERALAIPGSRFDECAELCGPDGVDHDGATLFLRPDAVADHHRANYQVTLPCPHGTKPSPVRIRRDLGQIEILSQRHFEGDLMTVGRCVACATMFRLPYSAAGLLACHCRTWGDFQGGETGRFWHTVADRMLAGYRQAAIDRAELEADAA